MKNTSVGLHAQNITNPQRSPIRYHLHAIVVSGIYMIFVAPHLVHLESLQPERWVRTHCLPWTNDQANQGRLQKVVYFHIKYGLFCFTYFGHGGFGWCVCLNQSLFYWHWGNHQSIQPQGTPDLRWLLDWICLTTIHVLQDILAVKIWGGVLCFCIN